MNYKTKGALIGLLISSSTIIYAQSMQCHATINNALVELEVSRHQTRGLEAAITVTENNRKLSGHYYNLTHLWDEHMTGMMTNEGISITYENRYGNVSNVNVTAYLSLNGNIGNGWIQTYQFDECTTPG